MDDTQFRDIFKNPNIPTLSDDEKQKCEGLVTRAECLSALKQFKNNKSPGSDGFTVEFYNFWGDIYTEHLTMVSFDYAFEKGLLSVDQRLLIMPLKRLTVSRSKRTSNFINTYK